LSADTNDNILLIILSQHHHHYHHHHNLGFKSARYSAWRRTTRFHAIMSIVPLSKRDKKRRDVLERLETRHAERWYKREE
jgi:hypothetical protein